MVKTHDEIYAAEVYAGAAWQAGMVKNLLENAGIESFIQDEHSGTLVSWYTAPGSIGDVKVMVSEPDLEKAKEIVNEYRNA